MWRPAYGRPSRVAPRAARLPGMESWLTLPASGKSQSGCHGAPRRGGHRPAPGTRRISTETRRGARGGDTMSADETSCRRRGYRRASLSPVKDLLSEVLHPEGGIVGAARRLRGDGRVDDLADEDRVVTLLHRRDELALDRRRRVDEDR